MATLGEAILKLGTDTTDFDKGINTAKRSATGAVSAIKGAFLPLAGIFGGIAAVDVFRGAITDASDL